MSREWYYTLDGAQYGPVDEVEIVRMIQEGEVPPGVPVCKEGDEEWLPARDHASFQVEIYPVKNRPVPADPPITDASHGTASTVHSAPFPIVSASNSKPSVGANKVLGIATVVASILCVCLCYYYYEQSGELERIKTAQRYAEGTTKAYQAQIAALQSDLDVEKENAIDLKNQRDVLGFKYENAVVGQDGARKAIADANQYKALAEAKYSRLKDQYDANQPKLNIYLLELEKAKDALAAEIENSMKLQRELYTLSRSKEAAKKPKPNKPVKITKSTVKNVDSKYGFIAIPLGEKDTKPGDVFRVTRGGKFVGTIVVTNVRGPNSYCQVDKTQTTGIDENPVTGDIKVGDDVELKR